MQNRKFLFVLGGNMSGLGKGISAASIGLLLKQHGYKIAVQKFDPYINVDPGTMNPKEHGEVFVLEDGTEVDLDLGHYERFIDINLSKHSSTTSGKMYLDIIEKERKGEFLGRTVQAVPHLTNYLKQKIVDIGDHTEADVVITEIGGTVGDAEGEVFIDAVRQFRREVGAENVLIVYLTYVPYLKASKELKSKLAQHAVRELRNRGLQPDLLICRAERKIPVELKDKIARFCDLDTGAVFDGRDVETIYDVPVNFFSQKMDDFICEKLGLVHDPEMNLDNWKCLTKGLKHPTKEVTIALVGKYVELEDAYLSVVEALKHAGASLETKVHIKWIDSEHLESDDDELEANAWNAIFSSDGILVPGGFGNRGIEGKIIAASYARRHKVPYLGICLGMQIAIIEFARNVLGIEDATSEEFDEEGDYKKHVIHLMEHQYGIKMKGGTMRLGAYTCELKEGSLASELYGSLSISRRHRHRYEVNNAYRKQLETAGMIMSGANYEVGVVEIVELDRNLHPHFIAGQFHPEFNSRLIKPEPLFVGLISAAVHRKYEAE